MNINFTVQYWNRKTFIKSFRDSSIEMKTTAEATPADAARNRGNARCLLVSYISNLSLAIMLELNTLNIASQKRPCTGVKLSNRKIPRRALK